MHDPYRERVDQAAGQAPPIPPAARARLRLLLATHRRPDLPVGIAPAAARDGAGDE